MKEKKRQNLCDGAKAVFTETFIVVNACIQIKIMTQQSKPPS